MQELRYSKKFILLYFTVQAVATFFVGLFCLQTVKSNLSYCAYKLLSKTI